MANPRDLAEQAFALLQDALRESEERVQSLDAQLKRQPPAQNELEERAQALLERLAAVEMERAKWEDTANQREEVAEAERAKVAQLRKRLEIAESGPEKLTKREINFWRGRAEQFDKETAEYKNRLANVRRELIERDALIERLRNEAHGGRTAPAAPAEGALAEGVLAEAAQAEAAQAEAAQAEAAQVVAAQAEAAAAERRAAQAERAALEARNEAEHLRAILTDREHRLVELTAETEHMRSQAQQWLNQVEALRNQAEQHTGSEQAAGAALAERDARIDALERELTEARATLEGRENELGEASAARQLAASELDETRATLQANDRELASLRDTLAATSREREQWHADRSHLEQDSGALRAELERVRTELAALGQSRQALEQERDEFRAQFAELETELKDEREHSGNMSQLANERRERITKLEEQVEEANERYEEAKWRLGKAQHFERLVRRRKGLVLKLLAALRTKMKANRALKAGLDGLRRFKAASEANQHKLLARLETLKNELHEARDALDRQDASAESARIREELAEARARTTELEERLATQIEVIETLETDLKLSRTAQRSSDEKTSEIERLRKEIEQRDTLIAALQTESEEHQRKLGKLRGSESETTRLRAISEQDRSTIDALERDVAKLKTELENAVKTREATIKTLEETAESWRRKYQFLANDTPDAYKAAGKQ